MPEKSEIKGRLMAKLSDGSYVEISKEISLEEAETMAEQYEFVRVVRCKDCRKNPKIAWVECPMAGKSQVFDDGYCHLGERGRG